MNFSKFEDDISFPFRGVDPILHLCIRLGHDLPTNSWYSYCCGVHTIATVRSGLYAARAKFSFIQCRCVHGNRPSLA
jgi:hypothetical protein